MAKPFGIDPSLLSLATASELESLERALAAELALASPADYAQHCDPEFLRPPHVELISDAVTALVEGRLLKPHNSDCSNFGTTASCSTSDTCAGGTPYRKLFVAMPPRHGKSEMISRYTPAWFLTKYPDLKVVLASYEADFAASWGRKARELVENHPEFGVAVSNSSKASARWELAGRKGAMFTAGAGGPVTGKGGNLLIVDDPVKNAEEAQSQVIRDNTFDWYRSTFLSRGEKLGELDNGAVILLQTRWHDDDLAGRLMREEPDEWYQIVLPAVAGTADPIGRLPGEPLWTERYNVAALADLRASMGPYWWAALYQQTPQVEGAGIFRSAAFRYWTSFRVDDRLYYRLLAQDGAHKDVPDSKCWRFSTADLAITKRNTSDFTCITTFAVTPDMELLVLHREKVRVEGPEHEGLIRKTFETLNPRFIGIERATFGTTLLQTLLRKGLKVRELKPDSDKVSRAYSAGALCEAGRAYFPRGAHWLDDWERELAMFPNSAHDDQVDTFAYAAYVLSSREHSPRAERERAPVTLAEKAAARLRRPTRPNGRRPDLHSGY